MIKEAYDTQYHRMAQTQNLKTPIKILRKDSQDTLGNWNWATLKETRAGFWYTSSTENTIDSGMVLVTRYKAVIRNQDIKIDDRIQDQDNVYRVTGMYPYQQFIILDLEKEG